MEKNGAAVSKQLEKLECNLFVAHGMNERICLCGEQKIFHHTELVGKPGVLWKWNEHTISSPTDAYGTIHFDGPEPNKAHFIRLSIQSPPELVYKLMIEDWQLKRPKLIISINGGKPNFKLDSTLKQAFQTGLLKVAKSTDAWIFTDGINTGISRRIGAVLKPERTPRLHSDRVVSIGVASWGMIENRHQFVVRNQNVVCSSVDRPRSKFAVLNSSHSSFLLVDNGTVGQCCREMAFRHNVEKYITTQNLGARSPCSIPTIPMVCLVVEGGMQTIRRVLEYLTESPPVPVIVCEGSGRTADLIALACKQTPSNGEASAKTKEMLTAKIRATFHVQSQCSETLYTELMQCVKMKHYITIFKLSDHIPTSKKEAEKCDLDLTILRAVFRSVAATCGKNHCEAAQKQLILSLAWNRVDIARSDIFVYGQEFPEGTLEEAMMFALDKNRVDFVKLFIEKGVQMTKFLTISRLEELYHSKNGPPNTLRYIVRDVKGRIPKNYVFTLIDIGLVVNKLMGGAYRSPYTKKYFRKTYRQHSLLTKKKKSSVDRNPLTKILPAITFEHPFNDLLVWAVLTKRPKMAQLMWQQGEEALAKSLVAGKLYRALASEAAEDDLEVEHCDDFKAFATVAQTAALELFEYCYRQDADLAKQLLTVKLPNWSRQSCLRLAYACGHKDLIGHPCSQWILSDMWMGGLRTRRSVDFKVICSILFLPLILTWEFPTKKEQYHLSITDEEPSETNDDVEAKDDHKEFFDEDEMASTKLSVFEKMYLFYDSPISTFWADVLSYAVFLIIFTLTVLVQLPRDPQWNEFYIIVYLSTFACEQFRQILSSEPVKLSRKFAVWTQNWWNFWDAFAVLEFFFALSFRMHPLYFDIGRVLYCLNIIYWYIRILRIFSVFKFLGPFVTMIAEMVKQMLHFLSFLLVVILAYGVFRQALLYPDNELAIESFRNVLFEPHFMIYGEIFVDTIHPPCGPEEEVKECVPGRWLNPLVMTCFLLVSSVLLLNVLIAIFNSIYEEMNVVSQQIWKVNRFAFVVEYKRKPNLPPPFIIFSHIYLIIEWYLKWDDEIEKEEEEIENGTCDLVEMEHFSDIDFDHVPESNRRVAGLDTELHEFEAECIRDLVRMKETKMKLSTEESLYAMRTAMNELTQKVEEYHTSLRSFDARMNKHKQHTADSSSKTNGSDKLKGRRSIRSSEPDTSDGNDQLMGMKARVLPNSRFVPPETDNVDTIETVDEEDGRPSTITRTSSIQIDQDGSEDNLPLPITDAVEAEAQHLREIENEDYYAMTAVVQLMKRLRASKVTDATT